MDLLSLLCFCLHSRSTWNPDIFPFKSGLMVLYSFGSWNWYIVHQIYLHTWPDFTGCWLPSQYSLWEGKRADFLNPSGGSIGEFPDHYASTCMISARAQRDGKLIILTPTSVLGLLNTLSQSGSRYESISSVTTSGRLSNDEFGNRNTVGSNLEQSRLRPYIRGSR